MKAPSILSDERTGGWSHTKIWANIGSAAMTFAFVKSSIVHGLDWGVMLAYGATVCGSQAASKLLSLRYMGRPPGSGSKPGDGDDQVT